MSDCLFCKIIHGDIPSKKVYENENVYAFKDIYPQASEHYLFISKNHTKDVNELVTSGNELNHIFAAIKDFTENETELAKNGFRVVTNMGKHGCQTVFHTHFHVLGGEQLSSFGK
tara:strand:+ start:61346 stop:61690 length:345 start_codon:yes stop_codon:yes gene_type:complete